MRTPATNHTRDSPSLAAVARSPGDAILGGLVAAHVLATGLHGFAHQEHGVDLSGWQSLFVAVIVVIAPLLGAWLHWRTRARLGLVLITTAMIAADVFSVAYHLVVTGDDNVVLHPAWHAAHPTTAWLFELSAFAVILTETAAAALGLWCLGRQPRPIR
jgi:hypothetical protein